MHCNYPFFLLPRQELSMLSLHCPPRYLVYCPSHSLERLCWSFIVSLLFILASVLTILYIIDTRDTVLTLKEGSVLAPLPPLYICPNKQMSLAQRGSVEKLLPVMKDLWVVWDRLTLGEDPMEFLLPWGNDSKAVEEMREVMYKDLHQQSSSSISPSSGDVRGRPALPPLMFLPCLNLFWGLLQRCKAGPHPSWTLSSTWILSLFVTGPSLSPHQARPQPQRGDRLCELSKARAPSGVSCPLGSLLPLRQSVGRQRG